MISSVQQVPEASSEAPARSIQFTSNLRRTFGALSFEEARAALEVRPDPVEAVRRPGPDPHRILLFGAGVLEGVGLRDHELGLPGRLADRVADSTRRGVDLDVVVDRDPTSAAAMARLAGLRLRRYDAVIVVLGDPGAGADLAPARWRGALTGLARVLVTETAASAGLFVYDSAQVLRLAATARSTRRLSLRAQPATASRLTEVTEQLCVATRRIRFQELEPLLSGAGAGAGFSDAEYEAWAERMAERLRPDLVAAVHADEPDSPRAFRNRPDDDFSRLRALHWLRAHLVPGDARLQREVAAAKAMFRVAGAAVNMVDTDAQWPLATTGPRTTVPRAESICDLAIRTDGLTLINDTWADPRTAVNPRCQGADAIRFYAAQPIRTWDGYRIGVVCIADTVPRGFHARELDPLRSVASRIERTIWADALR